MRFGGYKIILLGIIALLILIGIMFLARKEDPRGREALNAYLKGEQAKTIAEKNEAFNQALSLYLDLERAYHPNFGNGKLYFNLANTYFQLNDFPMAIYQYNKAMRLMPRKGSVVENLIQAKGKLGIAEARVPSIFEKIFFFHTYLSLPERIQLFFGLSLMTFLFASLYIWYRYRPIRNAMIVLLLFSLVMLSSLAYSRYLEPLQGIMIHSTSLYREASSQFGKALDRPILSGSKVEVLQITPDGKWIKVTTFEGDLGYVPQETVRLL